MLKLFELGSAVAGRAWLRTLRQVAVGSTLCCIGCSSIWDPFLVCRCPQTEVGSSDTTYSGSSGMAGIPPVTFGPPTTITDVAAAGWVAVGDFDGDGKLDLAVANNLEMAGTVSVMLGKGNGTFQDAKHFNVGASPTSIAVGDFNGDCKPDLAVVNHPEGTVSMLTGNGDGTFQNFPKDQPAAPGALAVATGDFNGDCKLDLAFADQGPPYVSVLPGVGDGTFQRSVSFPSGETANSVAVGDFDGDGKADIAVANGNVNGTSHVSVMLGNGDQSFQMPISTSEQVVNPHSLHVADFDGDGKPDLIVTNEALNMPDVSVFLNVGAGHFHAAAAIPSYAMPSGGKVTISIAVADFNRDKIPDIAVASSDSNNNLSVLLGNGMGGFTAAFGTMAGIADPRSLAVGDFNGDGKPDLAVVDFTQDVAKGVVRVFLNTSP